jgi:hypothetical protein
MRPIHAIVVVCLTLVSMAGAVAQDCKISAPVRFSVGAGVGSRATVARDTRHGRFVLRAERRGGSSVAMRFALNGRSMTPIRFSSAPAGARACLSGSVHSMSQARGAKKSACYVLGEPWCDEKLRRCYAIACCGSVCAAGSAAY